MSSRQWLRGACVLDQTIPYTGKELRPHFVLEKTSIYGNGLVAFAGPCDVPTDHLVDWEDRLAADSIQSADMLHVIGEFFDVDLHAGVFVQRLLIVWAERLLRDRGVNAQRSGDDLYIVQEGKRRKLSVSIATKSAVSVLIHWGFNIDASGAPSTVQATGFNDLGWTKDQVFDFAKELFAHYSDELEEVYVAKCKVKPV